MAVPQRRKLQKEQKKVMESEPLNIVFTLAFLAIGLFCKDRIISGMAFILASVQIFNFFYIPSSWIDLCFESIVCSLLGIFVLSQSARDWAVSLAIVQRISIGLILIEFIDYFLFGSMLEQFYQVKVIAVSILEIIILAMAWNGILHAYSRSGTLDYWHDRDNQFWHGLKKLSLKKA